MLFLKTFLSVSSEDPITISLMPFSFQTVFSILDLCVSFSVSTFTLGLSLQSHSHLCQQSWRPLAISFLSRSVLPVLYPAAWHPSAQPREQEKERSTSKERERRDTRAPKGRGEKERSTSNNLTRFLKGIWCTLATLYHPYSWQLHFYGDGSQGRLLDLATHQTKLQNF